MAPGRYYKGKFNKTRPFGAGTRFRGTSKQPRAHTSNFRNNPWQEQQTWHNESPMAVQNSGNGFYQHSTSYLRTETFNDQLDMNSYRGTNYNQPGGDNRFGGQVYDERFSTGRKFEHNNYYNLGFDTESNNEREVFFQAQRNYDNYFDENELNVGFEDNTYYNEDVYGERNDSNGNWFSFENDIEITVQRDVPKRGHKHLFNNNNNSNAAWRHVKVQPFKNKGKKKFLRGKNIKKNFARARHLNSAPKKVVDPRFQYVVANFAYGTKKRISSSLPDFNGDEELLLVDQTFADFKNEHEPKTSGAEILISDSSEDSLVEIVTDKNDVNCDKKKTNADVKPMFCAACNVFCVTEKNFETHNLSNNHLIKIGLKKKVAKEEPVENKIEASEVPPVQIEPVVKVEENSEEKENDERSDDDIVEVDTAVDLQSEMAWNPDVVVGKNFMIQFTGFFCKLCKKYFNSIDRASNHCRSLSHFENCKSVMNGLSEVKADVDE